MSDSELPVIRQDDEDATSIRSDVPAPSAVDEPELRPPSEPRAKTSRPGKAERNQFQSLDFECETVDLLENHADLKDKLEKHPTGNQFLSSLSQLPVRSIAVKIKCKRQNCPVGLTWLADFTNKGDIVVDVFVIEEFRDDQQLAQIIRSGIIFLFSAFTRKFMKSFSSTQGSDMGHVTLWYPMTNVPGNQDSLRVLLNNFGYEEVVAASSDKFVADLNASCPRMVEMGRFYGRKWMRRGPVTMHDLQAWARDLLSEKTPASSLTATTSEKCKAEPILETKVLRSVFAGGGALSYTSRHATMVINARNILGDGVVRRRDLEICVEVHCTESSACDLDLTDTRVEVTASLGVLMMSSDKKPFTTRLFEGSNHELSRDSSANPPIFSGTVKLVKKDNGATNSILLGKRKRAHIIECIPYVICRAIRNDSNDTGLDLVSREFADERVLCSESA
jgi:hypothetical protein